jgi:hypothetical protein
MQSFYRSALSLTLSMGLVSLPAGAAPVSTPLGVVVLAKAARVSGTDAANGATIFQGDRLATGDNGRLQVRFGSRQAQLSPESMAIVTENASVLDAELLSGTISVSSNTGEMFKVDANGAMVTPHGSDSVIAQVTRVSPSELLLSSRKGSLEVTFDGESTLIAEGSTYHMLTDSDGPPAAGNGGQRSTGPAPKAAGKTNSKKRAVFILLGGAAAAGIAVLAVNSGGSSPSSPVSPSAPSELFFKKEIEAHRFRCAFLF